MFYYLRKCKSEVLAYVLVAFVYALILAATGFVYARVSEAALSGDQKAFVTSSLIAVGFFIYDTYFDYLPRYLKAKLVNRVMERTRNQLVAVYAAGDDSGNDDKKSADKIHILVNHMDVLENGYLTPLLSMLTSLLVFTFSLIGALYLQGTMTLIMLALCFIPFLAPLINNRILAHATQDTQSEKNAYLKLFSEFVHSLTFIRISTITPIFEEKLQASSQEYARRANHFSKKQSQTYAVSYGLSSVVYSGAWIIGGIFVFQGLLKISDLIAMTTLMGTVAGPIQTMSGLVTDYLASRTVVADLTTILQGQFQENEAKEELTETIDSISLETITYEQNNHRLFDRFSYRFLANRKYAILGKSGSGKTTLLRLLLGVQKADEGRVLVNQTNLADLEQTSVFGKIYYLPQKTAIFSASIGENLSLFGPLDQDKALTCLSRVGLLDWFERQENGFATLLSSAQQLSGGEERRFDIARALYRDAEVLLFDEPTTGLDTRNESLIAETLSKIEDKLVIVVTHSQNEEFLGLFDERLVL
ncbi:TPA: ABC transporter ATP-binding protein [Streptococcus suis]|nr:ABC transporter ATP-binding protein [Streptococcus suis]HEM5227366.1 ABC transporter ATP-binding protein [Streptococcus suis]HEM5232317.1 ABC transporter ATP-binding protein [Streptococcus suis]HEM5238220.1 ABC transporter ATP-binding protein [Streptococcus suis]HEM5246455.1 ABC transporter ATP-binding protein [Streptococcus suis]